MGAARNPDAAASGGHATTRSKTRREETAMSVIRKLTAAALGAAIATAGSTAAWAAEYEFKLHHFLGPKAPAHRLMLEPWARSIMDASGGRIAIEIFPAMSLGGKPPQLPRQVRDGVVDIAWIVNAYAAGQFPRTEVFELPGVHQGRSAAVNMAMETMYEGEPRQGLQGRRRAVPARARRSGHPHGGRAGALARGPGRQEDPHPVAGPDRGCSKPSARTRSRPRSARFRPRSRRRWSTGR